MDLKNLQSRITRRLFLQLDQDEARLRAQEAPHLTADAIESLVNTIRYLGQPSRPRPRLGDFLRKLSATFEASGYNPQTATAEESAKLLRSFAELADEDED